MFNHSLPKKLHRFKPFEYLCLCNMSVRGQNNTTRNMYIIVYYFNINISFKRFTSFNVEYLLTVLLSCNGKFWVLLFTFFFQVSWCLWTCIVSNTELLHFRRFLTTSSQSKCIFCTARCKQKGTLLSDCKADAVGGFLLRHVRAALIGQLSQVGDLKETGTKRVFQTEG